MRKFATAFWSDRGLFELASFEYSERSGRRVFKFHMRLSHAPDSPDDSGPHPIPDSFRRVIPSHVKEEVFKKETKGGALSAE
jgi:hypothetical protein